MSFISVIFWVTDEQKSFFVVLAVVPFSILSKFLLCSAFSYYSSMTAQRPLPQEPIPSMLITRYLVLFYRHTQGHGKTIRSIYTSIDTRSNIRYLTVTSLKCILFIRLNIHQRPPTYSALRFYEKFLAVIFGRTNILSPQHQVVSSS